jgi:hypothetical protein
MRHSVLGDSPDPSVGANAPVGRIDRRRHDGSPVPCRWQVASRSGLQVATGGCRGGALLDSEMRRISVRPGPDRHEVVGHLLPPQLAEAAVPRQGGQRGRPAWGHLASRDPSGRLALVVPRGAEEPMPRRRSMSSAFESACRDGLPLELRGPASQPSCARRSEHTEVDWSEASSVEPTEVGHVGVDDTRVF